jgi:hypothetical protein
MHQATCTWIQERTADRAIECPKDAVQQPALGSFCGRREGVKPRVEVRIGPDDFANICGTSPEQHGREKEPTLVFGIGLT